LFSNFFVTYNSVQQKTQGKMLLQKISDTLELKVKTVS